MSAVIGTVNANAISQNGVTINNTEIRIPEVSTNGQFKGGYFINTGSANATITYSNGTTAVLPAGQSINFSSDNGQSYKPMNIDATGTTVEGTYYL